MGDFGRQTASLLAWAVRQGGTMVIIQAEVGMECVGMLEHELVCGPRRERRAETRRAKKSREDKVTKCPVRAPKSTRARSAGSGLKPPIY